MENNNSVIEVSDDSIISVSSDSAVIQSDDSIISVSSDSADTITDDSVSLVSESAHIAWGNLSYVASFDGRSFTFDSSSAMILPQPRTSTRLVQRIDHVDTSIESENGV